MLSKEREQEIVNIMKDCGGFVTVRHLCGALYVSESSIRRDLKALEARGIVKRAYGGAELVNGFSGIVTFNFRTQQNVIAKRAIAKKAAALVEDGTLLFLDQSSTSFYLAEALRSRSSVTVVTNNIEIMLLLSDTSLRVVSSGGYLSDENRNCLLGADARQTFEGIYADYAFFSARSLSGDGIITDCSREEVALRNAMLQNAQKRIFLCDSTKFDSRSPYRQCSLSQVDYLISETDAARFAACAPKLEIR